MSVREVFERVGILIGGTAAFDVPFDMLVAMLSVAYKDTVSSSGQVHAGRLPSTVASANLGIGKPQGSVVDKGIDKPQDGYKGTGKPLLTEEEKRIRNGNKRRRNRANRKARRGVAPTGLTEYERRRLEHDERKLELETLRSRAYVESRGNAAFREELDVKRTDAYVASQTALAKQSYANALKTGAPTIVSKVTSVGSVHSVTRSASMSELDALLSPKDSVSQQSGGSDSRPVGGGIPDDHFVMPKYTLTSLSKEWCVAKYVLDGVSGYVVPLDNSLVGGVEVRVAGDVRMVPLTFVSGAYVVHDEEVYARMTRSFKEAYSNVGARDRRWVRQKI